MDFLEAIRNSTIKADDDSPLVKFPVKISDKNYHEIAKNSSNKFCFIDGGNSEIINSNNLSYQLIRVGAVIFSDKFESQVREDYKLLITLKDNKVKAVTQPEKINLEFDMNDESLKDGKSLAKISKVGGFIRRILELDLAFRMAPKADAIILDGSLEEKFTYEKDYLQKIYDLDKTVIGFCKTNSLLTVNGKSLSAVLDKEGSWYYNPITTKNLGFDIFMVKLHEKSHHVFRVDLKGSPEIFSSLINQCNDGVFIGYPYGLVLVDRVARITNKEKEFEKTRLMVQLGDDWKKVRSLMASQDAHEILDNIG